MPKLCSAHLQEAAGAGNLDLVLGVNGPKRVGYVIVSIVAFVGRPLMGKCRASHRDDIVVVPSQVAGIAVIVGHLASKLRPTSRLCLTGPCGRQR